MEEWRKEWMRLRRSNVILVLVRGEYEMMRIDRSPGSCIQCPQKHCPSPVCVRERKTAKGSAHSPKGSWIIESQSFADREYTRGRVVVVATVLPKRNFLYEPRICYVNCGCDEGEYDFKMFLFSKNRTGRRGVHKERFYSLTHLGLVKFL